MAFCLFINKLSFLSYMHWPLRVVFFCISVSCFLTDRSLLKKQCFLHYCCLFSLDNFYHLVEEVSGSSVFSFSLP